MSFLKNTKKLKEYQYQYQWLSNHLFKTKASFTKQINMEDRIAHAVKTEIEFLKKSASS